MNLFAKILILSLWLASHQVFLLGNFKMPHGVGLFQDVLHLTEFKLFRINLYILDLPYPSNLNQLAENILELRKKQY